MCFFFKPSQIIFEIVPTAATSSRQFKNVCVLFGFRNGKYKEFVQTFIDLGCVIVERKLHHVYRGGD